MTDTNTRDTQVRNAPSERVMAWWLTLPNALQLSPPFCDDRAYGNQVLRSHLRAQFNPQTGE